MPSCVPRAALAALLVLATASSGRLAAQLAPEAPGASEAPEAPDADLLSTAVLGVAADYVGTRYVMGGTDPDTGLDCSAFVRHLFAGVGIALPRTSREQAREGRSVRRPRRTAWREVLRPGDLVFFASRGRRIDHVAVYAGDGRIVHASAYGRAVRYDDLDSPHGRWLMRRFAGARRVLGVVLPTDWTAPSLGAALVERRPRLEGLLGGVM